MLPWTAANLILALISVLTAIVDRTVIVGPDSIPAQKKKSACKESVAPAQIDVQARIGALPRSVPRDLPPSLLSFIGNVCLGRTATPKAVAIPPRQVRCCGMNGLNVAGSRIDVNDPAAIGNTPATACAD